MARIASQLEIIIIIIIIIFVCEIIRPLPFSDVLPIENREVVAMRILMVHHSVTKIRHHLEEEVLNKMIYDYKTKNSNVVIYINVELAWNKFCVERTDVLYLVPNIWLRQLNKVIFCGIKWGIFIVRIEWLVKKVLMTGGIFLATDQFN